MASGLAESPPGSLATQGPSTSTQPPRATTSRTASRPYPRAHRAIAWWWGGIPRHVVARGGGVGWWGPCGCQAPRRAAFIPSHYSLQGNCLAAPHKLEIRNRTDRPVNEHPLVQHSNQTATERDKEHENQERHAQRFETGLSQHLQINHQAHCSHRRHHQEHTGLQEDA